MLEGMTKYNTRTIARIESKTLGVDIGSAHHAALEGGNASEEAKEQLKRILTPVAHGVCACQFWTSPKLLIFDNI
jgi:hypothetical protein